jgi:hypothetical protein
MDGNYINAFMQNQSKGGMYLVTPQPIDCESGLYVNMLESAERDIYRGFFGRVKWCRELKRSEDLNDHFGVGIHFVIKSHQYFGGIGCMTECCCDICGEKMALQKLIKTREFVLECPACHSALDRYPDGSLKSTINNYLMGNIL